MARRMAILDNNDGHGRSFGTDRAASWSIFPLLEQSLPLLLSWSVQWVHELSVADFNGLADEDDDCGETGWWPGVMRKERRREVDGRRC